MEVALVTTPPSVRSGIGDYTRHLVPALRKHCDVRVYVEPGLEGEDYLGEPTRPADELDPRVTPRILFQLGNESRHAFMARMVRAMGGTVMQHDWVLFDLALAAWPGLARGGLKGHALALREGGVDLTRVYMQNWLDRRQQRMRPPLEELEDPSRVPGVFLCGWHAPETKGRWAADRALFRLPGRGCRRLSVRFASEPGRKIDLLHAGALLASTVWGENGQRDVLEVELDAADEPVIVLRTLGISVTPEQRRHGDTRRLGTFVKEIRWEDAEGEHRLDHSVPETRPIRGISLSRDRFRLPFNRSIVRFADAFIVHSDYVRRRILADRNASTPVGVLRHGAERRWRDEDRRETRRRLGLPPEWCDGFLLVSFGGVQARKRIDKVLEGLALARRERADVRLVLAGRVESEELDAVATSKILGIEDAVHFTGYVPEEEGWDWIHAGDVSINLRGPTTGGTSGGIFQSFGLGRPVIASDAAEQRELPDACTVKVPLGEGEVEAVARVLVELRDDPARCRALEAGARSFVDEECHWDLVAERYAEYVDRFPLARGAKRSLFARPDR